MCVCVCACRCVESHVFWNTKSHNVNIKNKVLETKRKKNKERNKSFYWCIPLWKKIQVT